MLLSSYVSSDLFLHIPSRQSQDRNREELRIISFITGNPGLIGYYHLFLSSLADSEEARDCVIYGASLGGFEVSAPGEPENRDDAGDGGQERDGDIEGLLFPKNTGGRQDGKMWGLREQVELCMARLDELVKRLEEGNVPTRVKVVLMGHSVGAWIALEMIKSLNSRREGSERYETATNARGNKEPGGGYGTDEKRKEREHLPAWEVEAAILLTPTIVDLHLSNSGRVAAPLLGNVPYLPEVLQFGASGLRWVIGEQWLRWVLSKATGMQKGDGCGLDTTVNFWMSKTGVQQSLSLARDELRIIREDNWGEEVWGALEDGTGEMEDQVMEAGAIQERSTSPLLYFLFADKDHWVADETRKEILRARARDNGRNRFVVDEAGVQHAWCLRQNRKVADRVKGWLREIRELKTCLD